MFEDADLRSKLGRLFATDSNRFDELIASAGLDPKIDLVGADLQGADFAGSVMDEWNLSRCDLTGASFVGARIRALKTKGAVGLDLTGAIELDDPVDARELGRDDLDQLIAQIRGSSHGAQRGPLIRDLLGTYSNDERTWSFLMSQHLKRERVGKYVSLIIDAWETRQEAPKLAGTNLRFQLLRRGGVSYITVRARLFRELAARVGPNAEFLELCKVEVEKEGYFSSGIAAMTVLASTFAGNDEARAFLEEIISRPTWLGSRAHATSALLGGFNNASVRRSIEAAILDEAQNKYQRAAMLAVYGREIPHFAKMIFEMDVLPELRAAAITSRIEYGDLHEPNALKTIYTIASEDKDDEVRSAAIHAVAELVPHQLDFVLERAISDNSERVRSTAVMLADFLGCEELEWFKRRFVEDPADAVRTSALFKLLEPGSKAIPEPELRDLLVREIERADPGYAAGRAGHVALDRWANDPSIPGSVTKMLERLPENTGGWNWMLRSKLRSMGYIQ